MLADYLLAFICDKGFAFELCRLMVWLALLPTAAFFLLLFDVVTILEVEETRWKGCYVGRAEDRLSFNPFIIDLVG